MRLYKFPARFCEDSRPYWVLFVCFIVFNSLLVYTLYTRQPERYRRISRWLSFRPVAGTVVPTVQAANFTLPLAARGMTTMTGTTLRGLPARRAAKRGGQRPRFGVEILAIRKKSVPYLSGFRKGDIIVSVNRVPCRGIDDLDRLIAGQDPSKGILFDVCRNGRFYYMTLEPTNVAR